MSIRPPHPNWNATPLKPTASPFGTALRHFRESQKLSQARVASAADLNHSHVSRLESGARNPTREVVTALTTALGLSPTDADALMLAGGFVPDGARNFLDVWVQLPPMWKVQVMDVMVQVAKDQERAA